MNLKQGLLVLALILAVIFVSGCAQPQNITFDVEAPFEVQKDQEFDVVLKIKNTGALPQTLVAVYFDESLIEGLAVKSVNPDYKDTGRLFGQWYYDYGTIIPAGQEMSVVFTVRAVKAGDFHGIAEACVNTEWDCLAKDVRVLVSE
jgi:hypothetical protein